VWALVDQRMGPVANSVGNALDRLDEDTWNLEMKFVIVYVGVVVGGRWLDQDSGGCCWVDLSLSVRCGSVVAVWYRSLLTGGGSWYYLFVHLTAERGIRQGELL